MVDYIIVTELPCTKSSKEQLERLYQRYHFASGFCKDKQVLEVACGAGIGLGYLAKTARRIVGGDIDKNNLKFAQEYYRNREKIGLQILDAHELPFPNNSFDVVILYEAIYYLTEPEKFIEESYRVLKKDGMLIVGTVNKDWADFNPSPYSIKYFSVNELYQLINKKFSKVEIYGSFLVTSNSVKDKIISIIKKLAKIFNLIPKTMKGKELFKRIFFGKLTKLPPEITDGMAKYNPPVTIPSNSANSNYKVLYAVGWKKG